MRENQLRRSVLPLSALMTAGALVLSTSPDATAAMATSTNGTAANEDPVPGEVAATATESDTETARQTEQVTVVATRKLTPKVKASGKGSARATRTAKASATVKLVRYAATYDEALADAQHDAEQAAHAEAAKLARSRAAKLALAAAKKEAKGRARHKADANVRSRFGTLVLRKAHAERGKPYRWGAQGPNAFDCSGLVRYVMRSVGVKNLPRTSSEMARKAHRIPTSKKQRGDLIFFSSGRHVNHVAIYAGDGMIWHSPGTGKHVQKIKIWTSDYEVGRLLA